MIENIDKRIDEVYEDKRRVYPCRSNRASQLGHPCLRYLVYTRKDWDKKTLPSLDLMYIFEGGEYIEEIAVNRLKKGGFIITQQQRDFEDKKTGITGHIDGFIASPEAPEKKYPLEIKGINQWDWEAINSPEDMIKSDKIWLKSYPAQLQLYLYLSNSEEGMFYIINKANLKGKTIWVKMDYEYVDNLLRKAEEIEEYLKKDKYPDRIPFDPDICLSCDFSHLCMPEKSFSEKIDIQENEELEKMIEERESLVPYVKRYEELDKEIKEIGKIMSKDNLVVGKYIISRKIIKGVRKPSPGGEYTSIRIDIKKLSELE